MNLQVSVSIRVGHVSIRSPGIVPEYEEKVRCSSRVLEISVVMTVMGLVWRASCTNDGRKIPHKLAVSNVRADYPPSGAKHRPT